MKLHAGLIVAAVLTSGCASIWSRGFVQDSQGRPLKQASVRVTSVAESGTVVAAATNDFGCFLFGRVPPRGERRFRLEVSATGYVPATFEFDLQTPILIVTLAESGSGGRSEIRAASSAEREHQWESYCDPPLPSGAQQLSPR